MILIPRPLLRAFRGLARKCAAGRPRGPAPPVAVRHDRDAAVLAAHADGVVLTGRLPHAGGPFDPLLLPADVLDAAGGPGDGPVAIAAAGRTAHVRWDGTSRPVAVTRPDLKHAVPDEPQTLAPVPAAFLAALHEAGRTAGRCSGRFALSRVQVRGDAGDVIASDGLTLYWQTGFALPFPEAVLVPAVPLFGHPAWAAAPGACVGRATDHLVVRAGPWAAYLPIDHHGRYPDAAAVVPRTPTPTTVALDPADAVVLRDGLADLPGDADEKRPVTLDLAPGRPAVVRGRDAATGTTAELVLSRSVVSNGPSRVAVGRAFLLRAVALGCTTVRVVGEGKPVVAARDGLTWLAASLHPDAVVPPADGAATVPPAATRDRRPLPQPRTRTEEHPPMNPPQPTGRPGDRGEAADAGPLAEAEALRSSLFDAHQAAGRLVALLKARKKEQRALASVYSSLKSLHLGP